MAADLYSCCKKKDISEEALASANQLKVFSFMLQHPWLIGIPAASNQSEIAYFVAVVFIASCCILSIILTIISLASEHHAKGLRA